MSDTRKQVHEIEIDATPEQVWEQLSEAEKITRWFAPQASVTPGVGGSITIGWGPGMEGTAPIHLWEPGHQIGWTEPGERPKLVEMTIEAKDGKTTLKLVQSGFGEGAKFEDEFESVNGGWRTFFRVLKYGLEHHAGKPCVPVCVFRMLEMDRDEITPKLSRAFGISPELEELREGKAYTSNIGISGVRLEPDKKGYYLLTAEPWENSLVALFTEKAGDKCYFTLQGFLFGDAGKHADALKKAFESVEL